MKVKTLPEIQARIGSHYTEMRYSNDPLTLLAGLTEEVGEIAHAIQNANAKFTKSAHRSEGDSLAHELIDAFVYLVALANAHNVDLSVELQIKFERWYAKEMLRGHE